MARRCPRKVLLLLSGDRLLHVLIDHGAPGSDTTIYVQAALSDAIRGPHLEELPDVGPSTLRGRSKPVGTFLVRRHRSCLTTARRNACTSGRGNPMGCLTSPPPGRWRSSLPGVGSMGPRRAGLNSLAISLPVLDPHSERTGRLPRRHRAPSSFSADFSAPFDSRRSGYWEMLGSCRPSGGRCSTTFHASARRAIFQSPATPRHPRRRRADRRSLGDKRRALPDRRSTSRRGHDVLARHGALTRSCRRSIHGPTSVSPRRRHGPRQARRECLRAEGRDRLRPCLPLSCGIRRDGTACPFESIGPPVEPPHKKSAFQDGRFFQHAGIDHRQRS